MSDNNIENLKENTKDINNNLLKILDKAESIIYKIQNLINTDIPIMEGETMVGVRTNPRKFEVNKIVKEYEAFKGNEILKTLLKENNEEQL